MPRWRKPSGTWSGRPLRFAVGGAGPWSSRQMALVAAAFRHRTSRAGDPQLHTHVLIANLGRGPDGRWSALDGRRLYTHARTASFLYQAVLRGELSRSLRVRWTPVRDGIAEINGVPREVLRAFNRRRADIEAALKQRGLSGGRAAEAAALATRRAKSATIPAERITGEWRRRGDALGFDRVALDRVLGRESRPSHRFRGADADRGRTGGTGRAHASAVELRPERCAPCAGGTCAAGIDRHGRATRARSGRVPGVGASRSSRQPRDSGTARTRCDSVTAVRRRPVSISAGTRRRSCCGRSSGSSSTRSAHGDTRRSSRRRRSRRR